MNRPQVAIVGAGFGGLSAARVLQRAAVDVLLIDKNNHHLFQPLLYQVAVAALSPGDIAGVLREIFRNQHNVRILMDNVMAIDRKRRVIVLPEKEIRFDYLIVATGSRPSYLGRHEWSQHAVPLKTISDAVALRDQILRSFETADRAPRAPESRKLLTFVIVGGGPTGVELAGALAEIAQHTIAPDFPTLKKEDVHIVLLQSGERILKPFEPALSQQATNVLEGLGVDVRVKSRVTGVTDQGVYIGSTFIETSNVIWAAGNTASPLLRTLDTSLDPKGRVQVERDLSVPGDPAVFVIGDAACCRDDRGDPLPGLASVAMQQGRHVAQLIRKTGRRANRRAFRYVDKGRMAAIGRATAVAEFRGTHLSGFVAWLMWSAVHIFYLIGFDRVRVMSEWIWYYLTYKPSERLLEWKPRTSRGNAELSVSTSNETGQSVARNDQ